MQTQPNYTSLIKSPPQHEYIDSSTALKAIYRQLFKENRSLDFFYNPTLDSRFLNGELTTRQFVCELLCSEMYQDYRKIGFKAPSFSVAQDGFLMHFLLDGNRQDRSASLFMVWLPRKILVC